MKLSPNIRRRLGRLARSFAASPSHAQASLSLAVYTLHRSSATNNQKATSAEAALQMSGDKIISPDLLKSENSTTTKRKMMSRISANWQKSFSYDGCETVFGNGFSDGFTPCVGEYEESVALCDWNPSTRSTMCQFEDLKVNLDLITVSKGGENIDSVMGRREEDEFPVYSQGAFEVSCKIRDDDMSERYPHHIIDMIRSLKQQNVEESGAVPAACDVYLDDAALLVTRYEYANLYHTYTDWYNMYQTARIAFFNDDKAFQAFRVVWMDGHANGALDDAWSTIVPSGKVDYISVLAKDTGSSICFRRAVVVPPGYRGALAGDAFRHTLTTCANCPWIEEFRNFMIHQFGIESSTPATSVESINILFVSRIDYLAHPRQSSTTTSRKIENEAQLMRAIQHRFPNVQLRRVSLETMSIKEQIEAFRDANIVLGMHGAGLSHMLLTHPGTKLFEIVPSTHRANQHFTYFSTWAGSERILVPVGAGAFTSQPITVDVVDILNRLVPYIDASPKELEE